jgi:SpoVK/Ycf46/Vps4 family AAA+-type ATPase
MPSSRDTSASQAELAQKIVAVKKSLAAASPPAETGEPPALQRLRETFGLSPFECDVLILCAAMELDGETAGLFARLHGDPGRPYPTFALLLALLPGGHWSAVAPDAPLRYWRLVDIGDGQVLTQAPLRIDERILHFLAGVGRFDLRLTAFLTPIPPASGQDLPPSHAQIARRIALLWIDADRGPDLTLAQLRGAAADCRPIAAAAARHLGLSASSLAAERLPQNAAELDHFLRLWDRECALSGSGLLLVDIDDDVPVESDAGRARGSSVATLIERVNGPTILREREPRRIDGRASVAFDVDHPPRGEQLAIWRERLGAAAPPEQDLAATVAQFSLSPATIRHIAREARARATDSSSGADLWDLCRQRMRGGLDGLAQRVESRQHWDDLVLPDAQKEVLRAIAAQLRRRGKVLDDWGFAEKSRRGLGLSALFYGPSGTGKTLAAEVLACEFRLDLYHIDLSRVVSKYIGETEANLRRVFDAAEDNGAILLFDEADSLFGARSEVKDSHDRYANIEVSYLLQRMEAYRGLAILTTNLREALDPAFLRRIRFAVSFPFPDAPQRAAIWRRVFPGSAQTEELDAEKLALLRIAGGNIRNIALNAAYLAADEDAPIRMRHVREAALAEYAKIERRLTQAEAQAWA